MLMKSGWWQKDVHVLWVSLVDGSTEESYVVWTNADRYCSEIQKLYILVY